jgi:hypothetical protein
MRSALDHERARQSAPQGFSHRHHVREPAGRSVLNVNSTNRSPIADRKG